MSCDPGSGSEGVVPTVEPAKSPSPASAPTGEVEAREPGTPTAQTEAESDREDLFDGDSACGTLLEDDTRTLNSFVTDYRYENNRRYHNYGTTPYWGPNDEKANETQDFCHHIYLLTLDVTSPISTPVPLLQGLTSPPSNLPSYLPTAPSRLMISNLNGHTLRIISTSFTYASFSAA